ncbi:hypothetical protein ACLB2K_051384 [Fragaria x ananassa]
MEIMEMDMGFGFEGGFEAIDDAVGLGRKRGGSDVRAEFEAAGDGVLTDEEAGCPWSSIDNLETWRTSLGNLIPPSDKSTVKFPITLRLLVSFSGTNGSTIDPLKLRLSEDQPKAGQTLSDAQVSKVFRTMKMEIGEEEFSFSLGKACWSLAELVTRVDSMWSPPIKSVSSHVFLILERSLVYKNKKMRDETVGCRLRLLLLSGVSARGHLAPPLNECGLRFLVLGGVTARGHLAPLLSARGLRFLVLGGVTARGHFAPPLCARGLCSLHIGGVSARGHLVPPLWLLYRKPFL